MKKIFLISIMLFGLNINAQERLSFSVLQDVKLGLGLDKKHLNDKPTLDLIANFTMEGKQFEWYYFSIQMQYEHAFLYSGYFSRYSINGIWNFNRLFIDKLEIGAGIGLGMINRHQNEGNGSYSGTIEISYPITKRLFIVNKNEWVRRTDLQTPKLGYNSSLGIKFKI
jgi:hypothetical protein